MRLIITVFEQQPASGTQIVRRTGHDLADVGQTVIARGECRRGLKA